MRLENLVRSFGQALGEAIADSDKFRFEREDDHEAWDTLETVNAAGAAPRRLKVSLRRDDIVRVSTGETLAIAVDGEDAGGDALRFRLSDDTLKIARRNGASRGPVSIVVTMPPPQAVSIGGAGSVQVAELAGQATVAIGGSGNIRVDRVAGERLVAKIGGSGSIEAAGDIDVLELKIGGSGHLAAAELEVKHAEIAIGGSGRAEFASDGRVDAKIGGSGDVLVHGNPRCSIRAGGSGRLRCVERDGGAPLPEAA